MPPFKPFRGVRYDGSQASAADVTAPPYDVISATERGRLAARHPHNVVHIDLPDETSGPNRYEDAAARLREWLASGVLRPDPQPSFYVYRLDYTDDHDRAARTLGVMGALELSRPGEGEVLPHEHTTRKAKTDRLELMRATGANLSPVWALSLTKGLGERCELDREPDTQFTDDDGVTHTLWRVADPPTVSAISEAVAANPVVIADGHHRYETALAYRDERRAAGEGDGEADWLLCFVVELAADQLSVRPIHRLLAGLPPGFDVEEALLPWFERGPLVPAGAPVLAEMESTGALALVLPDGTARLLVPRPEMFEGVADLDSSRIETALAGLPAHEIRFQHGVDNVVESVTAGEASSGVLLRPATVAQIADNARTGERMPPKTTFFHPKPRTGLVFRLLA